MAKQPHAARWRLYRTERAAYHLGGYGAARAVIVEAEVASMRVLLDREADDS